ncbi:DUF4446 family protein [Desmospora profundinema]|uniref:DUF4446 family protein n=1 Tax=Desmospora profundinema TaxID=1571184 RepID=A0ABU1IKS3_9BACL|nr:DUF4446 family protein [Desmospora profundinema]MDR6225380.1 hypothetical protein [Desmospora profundinema]
MENWRQWLEIYWLEVLSGLLVTQLLVLIWCVVATIRLGRHKQTLKKLIEPVQDQTLKKILASKSVDEEELLGYLYHLDESTRRLKGKVGLVRYNAIGERASDMSFSMAFLDERSDGVVISSLFSHHGQSYIYAKPVENGSSTYRLSKEEEQAIQQAMESSVEMRETAK